MAQTLEPPYRPNDQQNQNQSQGSKKVNNKIKFKYKKSKVKGAIDIPFFAITMALITIGLIMLYSASYPYALQNNGSSMYFFKRQLIFVIAGLIAMYLISNINYRIIKKLWYLLLAFTILCLVVVLFYHTDVRGFKRWIPIGPFTFQPSDLAKFTVVAMLATYFSNHYKQVDKPLYGFVFPLLIILPFCGLIYLEHHLSCTILVLLIGVIIMFSAGANWKIYLLGTGFLGAIILAVIMFPKVLMNYAGERITAWLDKSFDPTGVRWQTNNSLYAIGSGGFLGTGLGNSKQKYLYVSEPQNDFIFSIVCEELGFLGAAIIILLFALLFIRGVKIARSAPDRFGSFLALGVVTQIAVQTILNILVVTDSIPNTGISLPFFSYGGSAILILMCEIGVVLSISRKCNQKKV